MKPPRRNGLLVGALVALLGACATTPALTTPTGPLPDLRGAWKGTWGGTPLALAIFDQWEAGPVDGVFVGPWHVLGRDLPEVSGILTFTVRGESVSVNVRAQLGNSNGRLTLVLEPLTVNGGRITLTRVSEHRLVGTGSTPMTWDPQGPVELIRQPRQGPAAVRSLMGLVFGPHRLLSPSDWSQV